MKPDFTFVTYRDLPALDPDDRLAVDALASRGLRVAAAIWNDPSADWRDAGIVVIRSTWDYHLDRAGFLRWAESVESVTPLWNRLDVLRWNSHKSYIRDLAERGAPVVPTAWIAAGSDPALRSMLGERGWSRAVVKPAVGLATAGVFLIDGSEDSIDRAEGHTRELLRSHDVMVQPYIESVATYGERSLVFIAGAYSHAVSKTAFQILAPAGEAGEGLVEATRDEIDTAQRILDLVPWDTLYARVDLVRSDAGEPLLIELELVEPSLFMSLYPPAAERFAAALTALL
ncbi:MAG TPA: hypothetical protein VEJ20_00380 [Candidatus Eremiobacteraceae bacterium]|nr:hypothetical protein [Candidatus Eremiobacteraceae bacterium]